MLNTERRLTPSWELVKPSFDLVRKNSEAVIIIAILPALLAQYAAIVITSDRKLGLILLVVSGLWQLINTPISYYLQTKLAKKQRVDTVECYKRGLRFWPRVVLFEIMFALMAIAGFIALIVPGLIIIRRYYLTPFYLINNPKLSIGAAMEKSANQTKPVSGYVWGVFAVIITFSIAASIIARIPLVGPIIATLVTVAVLFVPALRWREINADGDKR